MTNHNSGGDHPAVQTRKTKYSVSYSNVGFVNAAILAFLSLVTMFKGAGNPNDDPGNLDKERDTNLCGAIMAA